MGKKQDEAVAEFFRSYGSKGVYLQRNDKAECACLTYRWAAHIIIENNYFDGGAVVGRGRTAAEAIEVAKKEYRKMRRQK